MCFTTELMTFTSVLTCTRKLTRKQKYFKIEYETKTAVTEDDKLRKKCKSVVRAVCTCIVFFVIQFACVYASSSTFCSWEGLTGGQRFYREETM